MDSCIYYNIIHPHLNYFRVDNLDAALIKISGGIIKNTIAIFTFQELLEKKAEITADIEKQVKPVIANWGIAIENICLKSTLVIMQTLASVEIWRTSWFLRL